MEVAQMAAGEAAVAGVTVAMLEAKTVVVESSDLAEWGSGLAIWAVTVVPQWRAHWVKDRSSA